MGRDRRGQARAGGRPDRQRQDAERVPARHRHACSPPSGRTTRRRRTRVLYISPLKALAVDVERNLRAPLTGIRHTAERLGTSLPDVTVGLRSGDTSAADRRRLTSSPPDIMITTPESLFLMLTSQARESLRGVDTVILDEVHAVAGGKRGAHLAVSLERLDALLDRPAQRIGLSATVRPLEEVARFLGGSAPVEIVAPPSEKEWDLRVVVPGRGHDRPRGVRRGVRRPAARHQHLAARRGARRRPGRAAPLHHRLRQLAPARGAADRPAQRDRHRARRRRGGGGRGARPAHRRR